MAISIALYSHDSVGLGHVRRNRAIAHALNNALPGLTGQDVSGILITGQPAATRDELPAGWDWLLVPGLSPAVGGYTPRHLNIPMGQLTSLRSRVIRAALTEFTPDLLIIDRHPFGVDHELLDTLGQLRVKKPSCRVILGLREVLDTPAVVNDEWHAIGGADAIREYFDGVWIYGDPNVHNPVETGEVPAGLADLCVHTGYLGKGRPEAIGTTDSEPFVLTTVGGGSDGGDVVLAAAASPVPEGHRHLVVTGPQMSLEEVAAAEAAATDRTEVVRYVPDALALARRASAVVCMGGYNTVSEVLTTTTPALVIPRDARRKEQLIRATALSANGHVEMLRSSLVDSEAIGQWVSEAVTRRVDRTAVNLDGLEQVAELAASAISASRAHFGEKTHVG